MARGDTGPWRGFERAEQAMHAAAWGDHPIAHYGRWLKANHPEHLHSFAGLLQAEPGGDTLAPETKNNPIPREWYHTDWVADLTVDWLSSLGADEPWFCWMSLPRPPSPVGPAGLGAAPGAVAGPRPAPRPPRLRRGDPRRPGAQAGALARLLGRARSPTWRAARPPSCPSAAHPRPDPRGQRQGARHERADRRGVRPRAADGSRSGAGWPTRT